ncbi:hypothetical protein [Streptomyces lavendulae]|uniref:hypothetical protein n=1 Tax=Streptomyces lavendulae TaxID=1914 RepID=UPI0024A3561C|nr:hypothetical protein [Streptomyces lavendulae]GLX18405.1 hypothetical protein Slala01_20490 [Streptomyces lavendulae subsp. lavendulae]GLX28670.1 hypothetical protein Slala02_44900 [Streptomyces lavendulae subsp. lavendulae]
MAALVYFRKISEGLELVRYEFGEDPENFLRQLVMEKDTGTSVAEDGLTDYTFLKASRKINAMCAEAGRWPDRGMSVS